MNSPAYIKERFERLQSQNGSNGIGSLRQNAFRAFDKMGIPTVKHEEWKYTRISHLFNKDFQLPAMPSTASLTRDELKVYRLPGHESANELYFINGVYSTGLSNIRSASLEVISLEDASNGTHKEIVKQHLGHSSHYLKDGINALNTALIQGAVFIDIKKGSVTEHPVYIYNITDARNGAILSQPRSLVHVNENARVQFVETYITLGTTENFTNQVMEIVVEQDAILEFYKIQNDAANSSQVSTTHIRQIGKSHVHTVTISLGGGVVRNNLNIIMEAPYCESHMYGLYFTGGTTHVDNHTVVDNVKPHCFSNEFYKGILDGKSSGVFNGKIFVRQDAQKTNAYQSNKNVLLSDEASVNTKPQLEIFADDVKCSHGCTIGQLDEEGLFYLRSRGISENTAKGLLLHSFAIDILDHIRPDAIRTYVDELISERLQFDIS